ncbi:MAG: histidine phosphatase family protein [Alphaproteobacteria bacterium]|nr:histidine phosphatase family protein [Alphaproteobacteria bacterium]MCD8526375.1 histidine phosphatase family protein [Alphaproteobacteria bacterium]MCD8571590.1 histidine phosphatase family protein [Alphaproteobacteria bacterium]
MARILFIRHGQSEGNVDIDRYAKMGDYAVGLTDTGWRQAVAAGRFLQGYFFGEEVQKATDMGRVRQARMWPLVYVSSYIRTKQTLSGVIHGLTSTDLGDDNLQPATGPRVIEEPRLIEKFFGATLRLNKALKPLDWRIAGQLWQMAQEVFHKDKFTTRNMLGDSRKDVYEAVCDFIDGPMDKALAAGEEEIIIVSHGAVGQEFIRKMMNLPLDATIPDLGNCDILEFTGAPGNWQMRKLYDGPAMRPSGDSLIGHLKPFTLADLPPVPEAFR